MSFRIRSIWKIWNITFMCWKWFNNTCYESMNFCIYSFFPNVWFFLILFNFSQGFVGFRVRSIWKIWNITFMCWKWFNNTCNESMNFSIYSLFTNVWLFFILFIFGKCFMSFWVGSIWKIWNFTFFSWKWLYNACNKSMNFSVTSFFSNIAFFLFY